MGEAAPMSSEEIEARVRALGDWFHNLDLQGVRTAPEHFLGDYPREFWRAIENTVPWDLRGKTALDVGCNAGFFSIEMKRRGADRVVGIDSDPRYLAQARLASEITGADIELRQLDVYDVAKLEEKFDVVLFLGVLYHLRHPLLALDLLRQHVTRDLLLVQTLLRGSLAPPREWENDYPFEETEVFEDPRWPKMHFVEHEYAHDWTNWWIPDRACAAAMLRSAGFAIQDNPMPQVFVCRAAELPTGPGAVYPAREGR
jgi:tRNA (mo5U34)-methyltransferase